MATMACKFPAGWEEVSHAPQSSGGVEGCLEAQSLLSLGGSSLQLESGGHMRESMAETELRPILTFLRLPPPSPDALKLWSLTGWLRLSKGWGSWAQLHIFSRGHWAEGSGIDRSQSFC